MVVQTEAAILSVRHSFPPSRVSSAMTLLIPPASTDAGSRRDDAHPARTPPQSERTRARPAKRTRGQPGLTQPPAVPSGCIQGSSTPPADGHAGRPRLGTNVQGAGRRQTHTPAANGLGTRKASGLTITVTRTQTEWLQLPGEGDDTSDAYPTALGAEARTAVQPCP